MYGRPLQFQRARRCQQLSPAKPAVVLRGATLRTRLVTAAHTALAERWANTDPLQLNSEQLHSRHPPHSKVKRMSIPKVPKGEARLYIVNPPSNMVMDTAELKPRVSTQPPSAPRQPFSEPVLRTTEPNLEILLQRDECQQPAMLLQTKRARSKPEVLVLPATSTTLPRLDLATSNTLCRLHPLAP